MGRKKINIREIENSRQKTVTFARRRAGLIKKAHELSILCGVKVAILMFDSKHASHVYSSADAPEELFARYLNKQFLTNESRKRKDHQRPQHDSPSDISNSGGGGGGGGEGTYGFDDTGSFVRRRLAVVNQYRVTSDGPSSENLQVKYTKQYHNPGASRDEPLRHSRLLAPDRTSTAAPSSASPSSTAGPPHLQMLQDARMLGAMGPMYGCDIALNAPDLHQQNHHQGGLVLPARSISLMRRGGGSAQQTPSIAMSSDTGSSPEASFAHLFHTHHQGGAGGPGFIDSQIHGTHASIVDSNIVLAARDLSSLSLLPAKHMHPGARSTPLPAASSSSYPTAGAGVACTGEYNHDSQCTVVVGDKRSAGHDEPFAKRPRSQVFAAEEQKCLLDRTLVEQFLADADVAQLLQASWKDSGTSACQPGTSAEERSEKKAREVNEADEDEDNEDEDNEDEDEDEEDADDDDSDAETDSGDGSETEGDDDDGSETGAHPDVAANLKAEIGAGAVAGNGLAISQTLPTTLPNGGVVAPGNGCLQFYSPDARLQVLSQQQQQQHQQEYQSQNQQLQHQQNHLLHLQQAPFACLPGAPSPFELAGLADSRRNPPSFLFTQGDGEGIHSYRLHPDMAYAINDGVF